MRPRLTRWWEWTTSNPLSVVRVIVGLGLAALIVVHGLWSTKFVIDTTTLGLFVLLLVVVILPEIEELEAFGVKLKRRIRDVLARATVEEASAPAPEPDGASLLAGVAPSGGGTLDSDAAGLALEARTVVVAAIRRLYQLVALDRTTTPTDAEILQELGDRGYVSTPQSQIVREIIELATRAIHGRGISRDDAARLNKAAQSVATAITASAPRAFEYEVGRILQETPVVEVEESIGRRESRYDYRVYTPEGPLIIEVKFWTRFRPERVREVISHVGVVEQGEHLVLWIVVPNIPIDMSMFEQARQFAPWARVVPIVDFSKFVAGILPAAENG